MRAAWRPGPFYRLRSCERDFNGKGSPVPAGRNQPFCEPRSASMKAAPFEYSRPADIDEACALLAADESARVIAGGQTLVAMMVMRLARPTRLIDINRIAALAYI